MSAAAAPRWLTWAGIALVLWTAIGVFMFVATMMRTPAEMAALPADQQLLWAQMPWWGMAGFAVSTIGGLIGALGIVLKKKWAVLVTAISVLGIIANFAPTFVLSKGVNVWQPQYYAFPAFIMVVALFQLWLARKGSAKGWLA